MSVLVAVAAIIAVIVNRGFEGVKTNPIRGFYLLILGFIIQLSIFNNAFASSKYADLTPYFYIASLLILMTFIALNFDYLGMKIVFSGSLLNFIAIISNSGYMPQYIDKLEIAKEFEKINLLKLYGHYYNGILGSENTHFKLLTDIFAIGTPSLIAGVYSIGDFIVILGLVIFIFEFTKTKRAA